MKRRSINVVVQSQTEGRALLWGDIDEVYICQDADELGSWALTLWADERIEAVESTAPESKWTKLAARGMDALGFERSGDAGQRVAVHCIVSLDERHCGVVYPPSGGPRIVSGQAELGRVLMGLATDESMPRVPAGRPPELAGELFESACEAGIAWLRKQGEGAA